MKKIITLIFLSVFCLNAINAEVTWELSEDGTLTISGTGKMKNYGSDHGDGYYAPDFPLAPWYSQRESIKNVIIENGVTSIGNFAFHNCIALTSITIPNSVTNIYAYAFSPCTDLTSITIPNSVTNIDYGAFNECTNLNKVTIEVNKNLEIVHFTIVGLRC